MAITDDQRYARYEGLIEVLGRERATTRMEHLPPVGWADVATKRDLDQQSAVLRHESDGLRREMRTEFAAVRHELQAGLADVRTELQAGLADVRTELQTGLADVRTELQTGLADVRTEIASVRVELGQVEVRFERARREQGRTFFLGMLAANSTLAGLAFAAAQLG